MQPEKSFGNILKQTRQARDLTQAELAEQIGCATESLRKMEANRRRPSRFLATRLADILALSVEERPEFLTLARTRIEAASPQPAPARTRSVVNLPAQMTSLVGRQQDLKIACKLLRKPGIRLVTLTGPGGVGKTRLAAQVALKLLDDFPGGVYFVPLAAIADASSVASAIAQVLHIRATSDQFSIHFGAHFGRKPILIVLDNFEHVLPAAPLVAELLSAAPSLRILVTSRTALNLYGEHELNVPLLTIPDLKSLPPSAQLTQYEAVRIFVERTRALKADFTVTDANAAAVAEICCRLDGLPLALELAAAYGKLLSPLMLLDHLKKAPLDLASSAFNLPERHSTLRNTIQWGYELLSPGEQDLFQQLSVFLGGCTLEAIDAICALREGSVLEQLGSLLDKSLIQQVETAVGEHRYVMLETIRSYASEQLCQSGREQQVYERHLAYYLKLAEGIAPKLLVGAEQWQWLKRLEQELGNLRAAIQWALQHQVGESVVRLCSNLEYFWYEFGDPAEIYQWIETVLAQEANLPTPIKATALRFTGYVLMTMQIDYPRAQMFFEEALRLWQALDNPAETVNTMAQLGIVTLELGDYKRSQSLYEECLRISESLGDTKGVLWDREWLSIVWMRQGYPQKARQVFGESVQWWHQQGDTQAEAFALNNLGVAAMYEKDYAQARVFQEKALALCKAIGDVRGVSAGLNALGPVALHQGQAAEAYAFLSESLSLCWEHQDYNGIAWNLERLGEVAFAQADWVRGAQLWGAAEGLREKYHSPLFPADQQRYEPALAAAHRQVGETAWSMACAAGRAAPIEEIVKYALEK